MKGKLLPNGRDKKKKGSLAQISIEMLESEAFRSLPASAMRVLILSLFFNYCATNTSGRPVFKFTNRTAKEHLDMNQQTYSAAKRKLVEIGFWVYVKRGGLKGCNGIASEFALSRDWKAWKIDKKNQSQVKLA